MNNKANKHVTTGYIAPVVNTYGATNRLAADGLSWSVDAMKEMLTRVERDIKTLWGNTGPETHQLIINDAEEKGFNIGGLNTVMQFSNMFMSIGEQVRSVKQLVEHHSGRSSILNQNLTGAGVSVNSFAARPSTSLSAALKHSQLVGCLPPVIHQMAKEIAINYAIDPGRASMPVGFLLDLATRPANGVEMVELKTTDRLGSEISVSFTKLDVHQALSTYIKAMDAFRDMRSATFVGVFNYVTRYGQPTDDCDFTVFTTEDLFDRAVRYGYIDYVTIEKVLQGISLGKLQSSLLNVLHIFYSTLVQALHLSDSDAIYRSKYPVPPASAAKPRKPQAVKKAPAPRK